MNHHGPLNSETRHPEDSAITSHMRGSHSSSTTTSKNGLSSPLSECAAKDTGGGVSLNYVFAIYSTATLPPIWRDILHAAPSATEIHIKSLEALANKISDFLPIHTSWDDIKSSPSSYKNDQIQSLPPTFPTINFSSSIVTQQITKHKPHFLINAALHERHCIIGQDSRLQTLLVILRRPWCVLEICVSNLHKTDVLEAVLAFAKTAQELDCSGYSTAVFLLEYELETRRCYFQAVKHRSSSLKEHVTVMIDRSHLRLQKGSSSRQVYKMCNTVFLPSLKSFNSFWIRLICVSAIETGNSFLCLIFMLCDQRLGHGQISGLRNFRPTGLFRQEKGRRQSETDLPPFSRISARGQDGNAAVHGGVIVEDMLDVYRGVLRRTADYI